MSPSPTVAFDTRGVVAWLRDSDAATVRVTTAGAKATPTAEVELRCASWPDDERLGAAILLEIAAAGVAVHAEMRGVDLAAEVSAALGSPAASVVAGDAGRPTVEEIPVSHSVVLRLESPPAPRRALLGGRAALGPRPPSDPGERLRQAVQRVLGERPIPAALAALHHSATALRAPGCCADGLCVRVCPTAALSLEKQDPMTPGTGPPPSPIGLLHDVGQRPAARFFLVHTPARCIGCDRCTDVCPHGALQRTGSMTWGDVLGGQRRALRSSVERPCRRCGAATTGLDVCQVCRAKLADPYSVRWSPEHRRGGAEEPHRPQH